MQYIIKQFVHHTRKTTKAESCLWPVNFVSTPLHVVYNNPDIRHTLLYKGQYKKMSTLTMDKDILLQCFLGIDVIENFDYMNQVNKTN